MQLLLCLPYSCQQPSNKLIVYQVGLRCNLYFVQSRGLSVSFCLAHVSVFLCVSLSLFLYVSVFVSLCVSLSLCDSVSVTLSLCVSVCISVSLCLSVFLFLCVFVSLFLRLCSVSLCVSVCLPLSLLHVTRKILSHDQPKNVYNECIYVEIRIPANFISF